MSEEDSHSEKLDSRSQGLDRIQEGIERIYQLLVGWPEDDRDRPSYFQGWCDLFILIDRAQVLLKQIDEQRIGQINRANARKKRKKRGPNKATKLRLRALKLVQDKQPGITAESLCDAIEADGHVTFDNEDLQFLIERDLVIVRDLSQDPPVEQAAISRSSLRAYLQRARNI